MIVQSVSLQPELTVFLLGAGASQPFGFPLGADLKHLVMNPNPTVRKHLHDFGISNDRIEAFREILTYSTEPTIDSFLEKKTSLRDIGSYLIAGAIMPCEQHPHVFPQRDWYANLFSALNLEAEEPDASRYAFVTLNYDRSLEHFLTKNIDYNCHDARVGYAHDKRRRIRIVHAHGSLGKYPEVPFGKGMEDREAFRAAAKSIRIVSDRMDFSPDFQEAQKLIDQAQQVVFLGFGYDERTVKALFAKSEIKRKRLVGTAFKMPQESLENVRMNLDGIKLEILTAKDFFQKYQLLGLGSTSDL